MEQLNQIHNFRCAIAVAQCIEACCEGSCITDSSCIGNNFPLESLKLNLPFF